MSLTNSFYEERLHRKEQEIQALQDICGRLRSRYELARGVLCKILSSGPDTVNFAEVRLALGLEDDTDEDQEPRSQGQGPSVQLHTQPSTEDLTIPKGSPRSP